MGSLHSFLARIGTMNLPHVRFVVERFSADLRARRNSATTALKRSTTNDDRSGCCSTIPRFMERRNLWLRRSRTVKRECAGLDSTCRASQKRGYTYFFFTKSSDAEFMQ